jgi:hypothetical protein
MCKPHKRQGCDGRHLNVKREDDANLADFGSRFNCHKAIY